MPRLLPAMLAAVVVSAPITLAGDFIIGTMPYERDTIGRVELPKNVAWKVMPEYRGARDDGVFTDHRVTVVLEDAKQSFWPVVARLETEEAVTLAAALAEAIRDKALNGPNAEHEARGMDVSVYTHAYKLNAHKAIQLSGDGVGFAVLPQYNGVTEDGERIVDERITLVLKDEPKRFWATIAWLDLASARALHTELERAIAQRNASDDC